jgi:PBP1b-binding outer membrane lipoprotein LpoB
MKLAAIILAALALTGCATGQQYQAYAEAHKAQAAAQSARYQALADIAKQGDTTAKVAAVMSLQMGGQQQQSQIAAPKTAGDHLIQWTSILLPSLTNIYGINKQASVGIAQSNNATSLGISTNAAFVGMASKIQAPAPNMTLSGTGVLGSGSYTIGANSGANSGNSGRLAGQGIIDNTSTPTVVNQPEPLVITQPAPIIVGN